MRISGHALVILAGLLVLALAIALWPRSAGGQGAQGRSAPAQAAPAQIGPGVGDAARGKALAERLCASCHAVAPGGAEVKADVPSFPAIAARPGRTPEHLADIMINPHPPMPDVSLTRAEILDITTYITSLKR